MALDDVMQEAMEIAGAVGVALVDYDSGMLLSSAGGDSLDLEVAAAGNTEVVRAKIATMTQLGLSDHIEDILITLGTQYHLIRLLNSNEHDGLFVYLALNRTTANLAMARRKLSALESSVSI